MILAELISKFISIIVIAIIATTSLPMVQKMNYKADEVNNESFELSTLTQELDNYENESDDENESNDNFNFTITEEFREFSALKDYLMEKGNFELEKGILDKDLVKDAFNLCKERINNNQISFYINENLILNDSDFNYYVEDILYEKLFELDAKGNLQYYDFVTAESTIVKIDNIEGSDLKNMINELEKIYEFELYNAYNSADMELGEDNYDTGYMRAFKYIEEYENYTVNMELKINDSGILNIDNIVFAEKE